MICTQAFSLGILLAAAAMVQARLHPGNWDIPPMSPMYEYEPNMGYAASTEGWNFSVLEQAPYNPGLLNEVYAVSETSWKGAQIKAQFFGYGAVVRGQAASKTRVTASLDSGETNTTTTKDDATSTNVTSVFAAQRENKWHTLTVTLDEGEVLVHDTIFFFDMDINYPNLNMVQYRTVNPTTDDYREMHPYFTSTSGNWVTQKLFEPGVFDVMSPHLEGDPGASFSFKTWPNASAVAFSVRLGPDKGLAKCRITPLPFNRSEEIERNLSRPVVGDAPFGIELLDPTQRYMVEITNSDPEKKLYFNGVSHWLASDVSADWDPASDRTGGISTGGGTALTGSDGASNEITVGISTGSSPTPSETVGRATGTAGSVTGIVSDSTETVSGVTGATRTDADSVQNGGSSDGSNAGNSTKPGKNVGAIVGGVVGGVVGAALLVGSLWLLRRRWCCHTPLTDDNKSVVDDTEAIAASNTRLSGHSRLSRASCERGQPYHPSQEADAGPVPETLPPSYNPAWAGPSESPSSSEHSAHAPNQRGTPETPPINPSLQAALNRKYRLAAAGASLNRTSVPEADPQPTKGGLHYKALFQNILS